MIERLGMNKLELEPKWQMLNTRYINGESSLVLLSNNSLPELNLHITESGNRALALEIPLGFPMEEVSDNKQNLILKSIPSERMLAVVLLNNDFESLFDDFIVSMYYSIKNISDAGAYFRKFLQTFSKWTIFFQPSQNQRLRDVEVQGLISELFVLDHFIDKLLELPINDILRAWRGPYNDIHDFIFEHDSIEVKSLLGDQRNIKIANERQLEALEQKRLELCLVHVMSDKNASVQLSSIIETITDECIKKGADLHILYVALAQKNLFPNNLSDYDNLKFNCERMVFYSCEHPDFPKITASQLDEAIVSVRYSINTENLKPFELPEASMIGNA